MWVLRGRSAQICLGGGAKARVASGFFSVFVKNQRLDPSGERRGAQEGVRSCRREAGGAAEVQLRPAQVVHHHGRPGRLRARAGVMARAAGRQAPGPHLQVTPRRTVTGSFYAFVFLQYWVRICTSVVTPKSPSHTGMFCEFTFFQY